MKVGDIVMKTTDTTDDEDVLDEEEVESGACEVFELEDTNFVTVTVTADEDVAVTAPFVLLIGDSEALEDAVTLIVSITVEVS